MREKRLLWITDGEQSIMLEKSRDEDCCNWLYCVCSQEAGNILWSDLVFFLLYSKPRIQAQEIVLVNLGWFFLPQLT